MASDRKICVGVIAGAHGVRGNVRIRSFTEDPLALRRYKPLTDETGKRIFEIKIKSQASDHLVAELKGVSDRDAAAALRNTKLFLDRAQLPKLRKREFYESDLIGLEVEDIDGSDRGSVLAVHNYGGGPFLEVGHRGDAFMVPFTKKCVPEIDIEGGLVRIDLPDGWLDAQKSGPDEHDSVDDEHDDQHEAAAGKTDRAEALKKGRVTFKKLPKRDGGKGKVKPVKT